MTMFFKNKIVVITGSANGIGKALVKCFLNEGAIVISTDINFSDKKINDKHYQKKCDVSSEDEINQLVDSILVKFNNIDIFCSNAGILSIGDEHTSNQDWKKNWDIHLMSHVFICRRILPQFKKQCTGHLVITSSAAGLLTHIDSLTYSVTKQASIAFAEWIAISNKEYGVDVSVLCPQAVKTNMTKGRENDVAAIDGILDPDEVAIEVLSSIKEKKFLILPHKQVHNYMKYKTENYDRWISGMQKLKQKMRQSK